MGSLGQPLRPQRPARAHLSASRPTRCSTPNPRLVSRELLTRDEFQPATTLNLLAGAWIQFEVHDWFSHGKTDAGGAVGDPARRRRPLARAPDEDPAHARATRAPTRTGRRRTSPTTRTGGTARRSTAATRPSRRALRSGEDGKLRIDEQGLPPQDLEEHIDLTRRRRQLLGRPRAPALALHARAQRDLRPAPRTSIRSSTDERALRQGAAVNAALMAKIHTVDWTPAIIAHPTTVARAARQLVGPRGRAARQALRPHRPRTR